MRKSLYNGLLIILAGIFLFSSYHLIDYGLEMYNSKKILDLAASYVKVEEVTQENKIVTVNFKELKKINPDIVAWIYCPDTNINYPVMQTSDNDFYLHRLLDKTYNINGSIFMDCRNASDFTDKNSIIYGHHMRLGTMFGRLIEFKQQEFYDAHPYVYIINEDQTYRMNLLSACTVDGTGDIYNREPTEDVIRKYLEKSCFTPHTAYHGGNIVTLSTCAYEFENARFILVGELEAIPASEIK